VQQAKTQKHAKMRQARNMCIDIKDMQSFCQIQTREATPSKSVEKF
jgi:predicted protein tyrosine phosphatase